MKLPVLSGQKLLKFLSKQGFEVVGQKGSHLRLKKKTPEKTLVTIVPLHKKIDPGTLLEILRQAELTKEQLLEHFQ
ncbi:MAG: type II toxin-antitoxin system HicA family toxin [Candidatus Micrarchaeota archaeon]